MQENHFALCIFSVSVVYTLPPIQHVMTCFLDACLSPYSKLLLTSPAQVLSLLAEEKAVLQAQLSQEGDAQGCFIQSALCLLQVTNTIFLSTQYIVSNKIIV